MENIHRSLPNRSSNGGYASSHHHKSVYDDVFGGPPRFSGPALAPRREDYVEIFAGASRSSSSSSSIPVLDIPVIDDESELRFDARFDYAEVFGECRAFDWTASFEDIVAQSSGGYDSSNEAWSPSQSGSLSDELDPLGGSDTTHGLPDGDAHQSLQSNRQFNVSYNKTSQRVSQTVLSGTRHVTKFGAAPGDTSSHETSVPSDGEHENCIMHVAEDINRNKELGGRAPTEEQYIKCSSNPLYNGFDKLVDDINPSESHVDFSSSLDRPFITISDISLRTKPSRLPPPSRPPPALAPRNVGCGESISKVKPSESYTFNGLAEGSVPPVFDREDAKLSAESTSPGNKNLRAKRDCSEESIERKEVQSHTKAHLEDVKAVKNKMNKMVGVDSSFQGDYVLQLNGKETAATFFEGRVGSSKSTDKLSDMQGGQHCDYIADRTAGDVAGREAMEYFEVAGNDIPIEHFEAVENYNSRMQSTIQEAYRHLKTTDFDLSNQMKGVKKLKVTKEVPRWDNERLETKMDGDYFKNEKQHTRKLSARLGGEIEFHENLNLHKQSSMDRSDRMMPAGAQQPEESGMQHMGTVKEHLRTKRDVNGVETNAGLNSSFKRLEMDKKFAVARTTAVGNGNHEDTIAKEECQSVPDVGGAETRELPKKIDQEGIEKQQNIVWMKENGNKIMESDVLKDEMMVEVTDMHGSAKTPCTAVVHERRGNVEMSLEVDKDKEMLMEDGKPNVNEVAYTRAFQHSGNHKERNLAPEWEALKGRREDAFKREVKKSESKLGTNGGFFEIKADEHFSRYTVIPELSGQPKGSEPLEGNRHEAEGNWDLESDVTVEGDQLRELDGACELDKGSAVKVARKHDNRDMLETAEEAFSCEDNMELKIRPHLVSYESEDVMHDPLAKVMCNKFSKNYDELRDGNCGRVDAVAATFLPKQMRNLNIGRTGADKMASAASWNNEAQKIISNEDDREQKMKGSQAIIEEVNSRDSFILCPAIRESVRNGRRAEAASSILEHDQGPIYSTRNASQQSIEGNHKKMKENLAANRRETELENERMRKIEEEREREREREKDRMAVDKVALERSFSGERVSGEVRQKAMAEARERLEKPSMEARLRAERAAVERATAEARQRAVEKSMAEKAAFDPRGRVEKSVSDRFSTIHRPADTRQSSLSSELHFQNTRTSNGLRHSYFPANVGAEGESPQRSKARLERYRRTAERAANALAEKNTRDLLAQKEREERNRVSEVLDAEVRRWSSGKEGNLRALLSTLQYILGPNSGWQPVPLTEVITSAAVKKAYRKATLCVHPDKLQQRGATVQQKYICEKVFDLLKDAWNKFNSEER